MAADSTFNWQVIEEKIQTCSNSNEQLGSLFASISHGLNESMRTRGTLDSGVFAADSQDWAECNRYADEVDQWLHQNMECMKNADESITGGLIQLQQLLDQQIRSLLGKTNEWKQAQRLALLGGPAENIIPGLNVLAQWFEKTEKAIESFSLLISQYSINIRDMANWCSLSPVMSSMHTERTNLCAQMHDYARRRKHLIVLRSFVVFEQPPIIVRRSAAPDISKTQKNSKVPFDLELRALAGESYGLRGSSLEVELILISEKQAQDIAKKTLDPLQEKLSSPGSLLAPRVILQAPNDQCDGQMSGVFRGVRVQSMGKRNEEDTDALYHILFRTKPFQTSHGDAAMRFWVISLPFAILSNAHRQDKYTRARMFWQMSFKINDETSLATVTHSGKDGNEIRWQDFFPALDLWFRNTTHCQDGLKAHWQYIADKLTVAPNPESLVSWDAFYKRKLGECQLTFWEWFCPIADYLAKMPAYWDSGLILGFVTRLASEHLLNQATLPSMVLRFSESNPGKMVVSYVMPHERIMEHVLFDEKENKALEGKSLAECIRLSQDLHNIQYILPSNKHVSELFALDTFTVSRPSESSPGRSGYVRPRVALVWRSDPPVPPDCLLNNSMDSSSYDFAPQCVRTNSECLSEVEFEEAARNLGDYLLSDLMMDDFGRANGVPNGGM